MNEIVQYDALAQGFSHTPCDWLQHYKRGCSISGIVIWTYMEFPKDLHVLIQIVLDHKNTLSFLMRSSLYGCRTIRADVVYPSKWIFDQLGIYALACTKSEIARVEQIKLACQTIRWMILGELDISSTWSFELVLMVFWSTTRTRPRRCYV